MKVLEALPEFDPRLLTTSEGRRELTRYNPLMFAVVYLPHKLRTPGTDDEITLNDFHLDVINYAKSWIRPLDRSNKHRDCFIAPRETGKSTWINHILPIWAGAFNHKQYILGFSDSSTQAERWLLNFKTEIQSNELLRQDFSDFVTPAQRDNRAYMDNRNVTKRANGFIFQVAGADNNVLGANIDGLRPQVLLFDDIEPTESNYSTYEAKKRLNTVLSAHFYLNMAAIVAFIGTTTMPDSIIDQIRKVNDQRAEFDGSDEEFYHEVDQEHRWVLDNGIKCHYWPAIIEKDGEEQSLWPEKWSMEELNSNRHTREFQMNMMNRPISLDGGYWSDEDISVAESEEYGNTMISIDPAVTTRRTSDYTGISVLSRGADGKIYVRHAEQTKDNSEQLRERVQRLIFTFDAKLVYVETNQGGDLWKQVFAGIPAKFRSVRQTEKKEVRAAQAHDHYRKGNVAHTKHFPNLEEQMLAFPRVPHDDVLDSVVSGVLYFSQTRRKPRAKEINYIGGQ